MQLNNALNKTITQKYPELWQGLGGYFHQDCESFEKAELELLDNSEYWLNIFANDIRVFLEDTGFTESEKKFFVQDNVSLSFSFFHLDPLTWLQNLAVKIKIETFK